MEIPQPVVLDSWLQFFKNTAQIGLIAIIIMCSSSMANEIGKGVLIPLLAKGMPRNSVLAAKFISISCLWTLSLGCSFLITFLYNFVFWESSLVPHLFPLVTGVWLFGLMMTASMILGGVYKGTVSAEGNTTIGCIVTNAKLDKAQCTKIAGIAHNGYARAIHPRSPYCFPILIF